MIKWLNYLNNNNNNNNNNDIMEDIYLCIYFSANINVQTYFMFEMSQNILINLIVQYLYIMKNLFNHLIFTKIKIF